MDLTFFICMVCILALFVVLLTVFLIINLCKSEKKIKIIDKAILIPVTVVVLTFVLLLTSTPYNADARHNICLTAMIIGFIIHVLHQNKKYEAPMGFIVAFVQNNIVLLSALLISLVGAVTDCTS